MSTNITNVKENYRYINGQLKPVIEQVDFFSYVFDVGTIAQGATATSTLTIQADADFVCTQMVYMASIANATLTDATRVVPLITVAINDQGSGRNLQNVAVDLSNLGGYGSLPFILPVARRFAARSGITATFVNYSAASDYSNVRLVMQGYKAWLVGGV